MYRHERCDRILSILQEKRSVTVNHLMKALYVSASTIRRDLETLEQAGVIRHYYGGAALIDDASKAPPIELRKQENFAAKMQIGHAAASLISDGDIVFIDASTTCLCMVESLQKFENLTVVSNGLRVLDALADKAITTYATGGKLLRNSMAFTGRLAEECVKELHFNKCFFSCQAIAGEGTLSDGGEAENQIHRLLVNKKGLKIMLCDQSKFNQTCMFTIGQIEQLDYIVSDADIFAQIQKPSGDCPAAIVAV